MTLGTCISSLKSVALTVFELLAFNVRCAQTDRHTQTHVRWKHHLRHSVTPLAEIYRCIIVRSL